MHHMTSSEKAQMPAVPAALYVHDEAADLLADYKTIPSLLIRLMVRDLIATLAAQDIAANELDT